MEPPIEFNYRLVYNEDSLHQILAWKSTPHTLEVLKIVRYLIIAKILTVEVPSCLWVHHLGMFSSGVIMLLIDLWLRKWALGSGDMHSESDSTIYYMLSDK